MEKLKSLLKNNYEKVDNIESLMKIYINVRDSDEMTQKDLLALLYSIDDKIRALKRDIALSVELTNIT